MKWFKKATGNGWVWLAVLVGIFVLWSTIKNGNASFSVFREKDSADKILEESEKMYKAAELKKKTMEMEKEMATKKSTSPIVSPVKGNDLLSAIKMVKDNIAAIEKTFAESSPPAPIAKKSVADIPSSSPPPPLVNFANHPLKGEFQEEIYRKILALEWEIARRGQNVWRGFARPSYRRMGNIWVAQWEIPSYHQANFQRDMKILAEYLKKERAILKSQLESSEVFKAWLGYRSSANLEKDEKKIDVPSDREKVFTAKKPPALEPERWEIRRLIING